MEKVKEVLWYSLLLLSMFIVSFNYWHLWTSAKAEEETRKLVEEWLKEGPPSTIVGKVRGYLPWWKMADPVKECGVYPMMDPAELGWLEYLVILHGAKERLRCVQQKIQEAEEEHLELTKMFCKVVMMMVTGVFFIVYINWAIKVCLDNIFRTDICSATPLPPGWTYEDDTPHHEHHDQEEEKEEAVEEDEEHPRQCVTQQDVDSDSLMMVPTKCHMNTEERRRSCLSLSELSDQLIRVSHDVHSGTPVLFTRPDEVVFSPRLETPTCRVVPDNQIVFLLRREALHLWFSTSSLISDVTDGLQPPSSTKYVMQQDEVVSDILSPVLSLSGTERGRGITRSVFNQSVTRQRVAAFVRLAGSFIVSYIIEGTHPRYW